ncbi:MULTISPECIES: glycosyltransferase family 4 protein [Pseudomonas]|uniref:MraY family glycosyltransferase n=1 Tax=Pseudomonas TaxID=286 RepID=UPI0009BB2A2E|nr:MULTISPECIES: glycosyltransferase family 4 protein [Pseudomonas]UUT21627.1 glycosyltransferase family 4 protein [Pseudomonas sp. T8]
MIIMLLVMVFLASWALTGFIRRYALTRSLLDIPNARSSHTVPTPRGGGVAIVVAFLLGLPVLSLLDRMPPPVMIGMSGAGLLVALIGIADDYGHIAARWRLAVHFIAAAWVLSWFDGLASIEFFGVAIALGWWGWILGGLYLVWMLNLYNFMDGIDGLASIEAICACLGMCLIYVLIGDLELVWAPLMLAIGVAGFLCWNFPSAKIFLGDAGSGFLGLVLGAMTLQAAWSAPELISCWLILLGVFIVDATWTLVRRLIRGDKVYQAHSSHAYQFAARCWGHKKVTVLVGVVNVVFLLPISVLVAFGYLNSFVGICMAYAPLVCLAYLLGAGKSQV